MTSNTEAAVHRSKAPEQVHLPAPSPWPLLLALGIALMAAGLVSSLIVTAFGAAIAVAGCVGWFAQVFPTDREVQIPVIAEEIQIASSRREVARIETPQMPTRARLPLEIYPVTAGIKGGLAGALAMALMAMFYGVVAHRSIWYPINLLGAVVYARVQVTSQEMEAFHVGLLVVAVILHITGSLLVGLLYGTMLPMLPRRPILLGGLFAPIAWTGLLHSILDIVDPALNQNINWGWFLASQIAFGLVAGLVVVRQHRVPTWQYPLAVRAGVDTPGVTSQTEHSE
jgi:hypothetical protein